MIFVTVGSQPFERLVMAVDELIERSIIKEKVFMQISNSKYIPKNAKWCKFVEPTQFNKLIKKANLIISHGGTGNIFTFLKFRKKIIIVPRLREYNEAIDDHQLQIANLLEKEKKAIFVKDIKDLKKAINKIKTFHPQLKSKKEQSIFMMVENFLAKLK